MINAQDYRKVVDDSLNKTITIKDCSGIWNGFQCFLGVDLIGTTDVAKLELKTPHVNYVIQGSDRLVAEFEIDLYQDDFKEAITKLEFYDLNNENQKFIRDYKYKYKTVYQVDVTDYETVCTNQTDSKNNSIYLSCENKEMGTHKENRYYWTDLDSLDLVKGKISIGIFTDVYKNDYVEFVPTIMNNEISEWATWLESYNTNLVSYYTFNESSSNIYFNDSTGRYNLTLGDKHLPGIIGNAFNTTGVYRNTTNLKVGRGTINFWIKPVVKSTGYVSISYVAGTEGGTQSLYATASNSLDWYIVDGTGGTGTAQLVESVSHVNWEGWNMITLVFNATRALLYRNGTLVSNDAISRNITPAHPLFLFGAPGGATLLNGWGIDEYSIWSDRELSSTDISNLWNNGNGITYNPFIFKPGISYNPSSSNSGFFNQNQILLNVSVTDVTSVNYTLNNINYTFSTNVSNNFWSSINLTLDYNNTINGNAFYNDLINSTDTRWFYYLGNGTIEVNITYLPSTSSPLTNFDLNYTIKCLTHKCRDVNYTILKTPVGCTISSGVDTNLTIGNLSINEQLNLSNIYSCSVASTYNFSLVGGSKYSMNTSIDSITISSSSGGAYTCDLRSSATRVNQNSVSFVIATLGSTGTPEDHDLTSDCYDENNNPIPDLTINHITTGQYSALYSNTGSGFCYIQDTAETCGFNKAIWNSGYIDNSTIPVSTSSGMTCIERTFYGKNKLSNRRLVCN